MIIQYHRYIKRILYDRLKKEADDIIARRLAHSANHAVPILIQS